MVNWTKIDDNIQEGECYAPLDSIVKSHYHFKTYSFSKLSWFPHYRSSPPLEAESTAAEADSAAQPEPAPPDAACCRPFVRRPWRWETKVVRWPTAAASPPRVLLLAEPQPLPPRTPPPLRALPLPAAARGRLRHPTQRRRSCPSPTGAARHRPPPPLRSPAVEAGDEGGEVVDSGGVTAACPPPRRTAVVAAPPRQTAAAPPHRAAAAAEADDAAVAISIPLFSMYDMRGPLVSGTTCLMSSINPRRGHELWQPTSACRSRGTEELKPNKPDLPNVRLLTAEYIQIYNNDNIVAALVIDECDSRNGCNLGTGYLLPCSPNTIAASPGV
uniref:Uncharacterized protein n=1 Tax=Oryza sativa subsp. japonica TaxID=39947 RepID=Q6H5W7_ORYSJ|nr:hypothetical protein [Oryza sativa Japonica Group]BAD25882.1 hypothetical protein [Oryza sativa Japonica Group]